jgi:molybdopterin synthase catalytic subunit
MLTTNGNRFAMISHSALKPEEVIDLVRTRDSGCVVSYVGLIRDNSRGREVRSVEYRDPEGTAESGLLAIVDEAMEKFPLNAMAIVHRVGVLKVNDINLVVAIGAGHRGEGLDACRFAVDQFKAKLPTAKTETYADGTTFQGHD